MIDSEDSRAKLQRLHLFLSFDVQSQAKHARRSLFLSCDECWSGRALTQEECCPTGWQEKSKQSASRKDVCRAGAQTHA